MTLELLSWNVNGIRAAIKKGFFEWLKSRQPDILCLQETRTNKVQLSLDSPKYNMYWNAAEKKGYSGVGIFSKNKPLSVLKKLGEPEFDVEGRFIQLEFDDFYLLNMYFPNSQRGLKRLDYKKDFNYKILEHAQELRKSGKCVIMCGDFNAAHTEIDLANPKANEKNAGYSPEERAFITKLIENGFMDTYRKSDDSPGKYTWWTYRYNARAKNIGWRIDYFFINKECETKLSSAFILDEVEGSDHCPVGIEINI
jgi:exodeoxyribonuclease-3